MTLILFIIAVIAVTVLYFRIKQVVPEIKEDLKKKVKQRTNMLGVLLVVELTQLDIVVNYIIAAIMVLIVFVAIVFLFISIIKKKFSDK